MQRKMLKLNEIEILTQKLRSQNKHIIVTGGCFDVLHVGHIDFLEKAKKLGDILIVLLESDETLRHLKGVNRPIHTQNDRARVLSALHFVDYVVLLPRLSSDKAYDDVIFTLKPAILATTIGDKNLTHKERQAKLFGAKLVEIERVFDVSTSKVLEHIQKEM